MTALIELARSRGSRARALISASARQRYLAMAPATERLGMLSNPEARQPKQNVDAGVLLQVVGLTAEDVAQKRGSKQVRPAMRAAHSLY